MVLTRCNNCKSLQILIKKITLGINNSIKTYKSDELKLSKNMKLSKWSPVNRLVKPVLSLIYSTQGIQRVIMTESRENSSMTFAGSKLPLNITYFSLLLEVTYNDHSTHPFPSLFRGCSNRWIPFHYSLFHPIPTINDSLKDVTDKLSHILFRNFIDTQRHFKIHLRQSTVWVNRNLHCFRCLT